MLRRFIWKLEVILIIIATVVSGSSAAVLSADNIITVYTDQEAGEVNRKILGTNILGLDPIKKNWPSYYIRRADYGNGIWNPEKNESFPEVIKLAKDAGISVVRFATGNHFNWKDATGKKRKHFLYGIDEFIKTAKEIGAEPDFTISYFTGNQQDAADLVEYLNAANNSDHPWAQKRAKNGHPEPYGIKYFEFGNEVFVGNKKDKKQVEPEGYAARYLAYQKAMKRIDSSVKLGLNLHHYDWRWDYKVLEIVGDYVDFVVRHIYPPKDLAYYTSSDDYKRNELFKVILGSLSFYTEKQFEQTQRIIKETTGKDDVPYAITEYNIGIHHKPQYKFSLGSALVNAELIRIFMKPENKVLMANNWDFISDYFGIVRLKDDYTKHDYLKTIDYIKRPNYHVYELYKNHFGDLLINAEFKGKTYDISKYKLYMRAYINMKSNRTLIKYEWLNNKWVNRIKRSFMRALFKPEGGEVSGDNLLTENWQTKKVPGVYVANKEQILKIQFDDPKKYNYYHSVLYAPVEPNTYYRLSGYIKTERLIDKTGVSLAIEDGRGWVKTHSGAQTAQISGTVDWQYVEVVYKTLPDATSVKVQARRIGNEGPLKGTAYFKDVKLQKYLQRDTIIPYLTVNASKSKNSDEIYLMVINMDTDKAITSMVELKGLPDTRNIKMGSYTQLFRINTWTLNGPSLFATNEEVKDNVHISYDQFESRKNFFTISFEPHSMTAVEIVKVDN